VLGAQVAEGDVVKVDGDAIGHARKLDKPVYIALNKPAGIECTTDTRVAHNIVDFVAHRERVFPIGRLDKESEGLILLTNDGELGHRLTHPSFGVPKTYLAEVVGAVPRDLGQLLRTGVELEDGLVQVDSFRVVGRSGARVMVEIVLHEGRNHVVRRLLAAVDHPVQRLIRTAVGPVRLGDLRPGKSRALNKQEIAELFAAVDL